MVELLTSDGENADRQYPRALILAPTSELCLQIYDVVSQVIEYLQDHLTVVVKISHHSIVENVALGKRYKNLVEKYDIQAETEEIDNFGDILICTPTSFIRDVKVANLHKYLKFLLIDEGDMLFLMGFEEEIEKIVKLLRPNAQTKSFQTVVLSATLDDNVSDTLF